MPVSVGRGGDNTNSKTKDGHFVALFDLQQTPEAAADQLRGYL
jgi:hypothetical protein